MDVHAPTARKEDGPMTAQISEQLFVRRVHQAVTLAYACWRLELWKQSLHAL